MPRMPATPLTDPPPLADPRLAGGAEVPMHAGAAPRMRELWAVPAALLGLILAAAVLAPALSPQDPYALATLRLEDGSRPPSWLDARGPSAYPLGTDAQGRDILSAVLYGLRVSLLVGICGTALSLVAGVGLGLVAGWRRGWLDSLIMRLADIQLSLPSVLIALFLMASWGQGEVKDEEDSLFKIIVAVSIVHWVIYARTVRSCVLAEREKDYVAAVRALGAGPWRIMVRHLLPNVMTPVLVITAVEFASIVMLEATLSFLGLGVPITRPSLGLLIKFGFDEVWSGAWWIWLFPGLALVILVLALNWLADLLRERMEPES